MIRTKSRRPKPLALLPADLVRAVGLFAISSIEEWHLLRLVDRHFRAALAHEMTMSRFLLQIESSATLCKLGTLLKGVRRLQLNTLSTSSHHDFRGLTSLRSLTLSGCDTLRTVDCLHLPPMLHTLDLSFCTNLKCLKGLSSLAELRSLDLAFVHGFGGRLPPLSPTLRELGLSFSNVTDLHVVQDLPNLTRVDLSGCSELSDTMLANLAALTKLADLNLTGCAQLRDLWPLAALKSLQTLNLSNCGIQDLRPLSSLASLSRLELANCEQVLSLTGIPPVRTLNLNFCPALRGRVGLPNLLSELANLRELHLAGDQVLDLCVATMVPKLERLFVWTCERLDDRSLDALRVLPCLKLFDVYQCDGITAAGLRRLAARHAGIKINFRCS